MGQNRNMPSKAKIRDYWLPIGPLSTRECFLCGYTKQGFVPERAHIQARCEGGPDEPHNLVLVCHPCHVISDGWTKFRWVDHMVASHETKVLLAIKRLSGAEVAQ